MYYEINIAINGSHYFATSGRSIKTGKEAKIIATELQEFYTSKHGADNVDVTIRQCQTTSREIGF